MMLALPQERQASFRQRFGDGHFYLACHAALPIALTPDLLYCLWANFQRDVQGNVLDIPWIAVSDILLHLCDEIGHELYEIEPEIRHQLLQSLQNEPRLGQKRLHELCDFLLAYVSNDLEHGDIDARELAETQRWLAIAYKEPDAAAREIALRLQNLSFANHPEWLRMAVLVDALKAPLADHQPLLLYTRAMADYTRGRLSAAVSKIQQAVNAANEVQVTDVTLPIPEALKAPLPPPESPPPVSKRAALLNYLKQHPWQIGGTAIASLALLFGIFYLLRPTPTPPPTDLSSTSPTPSPTSSPTPAPSAATPSPSPSALATPTATPTPPTPQPTATAPQPTPNPTTVLPSGTGTGAATPQSPNPGQTPAPNPIPTTTTTPASPRPTPNLAPTTPAPSPRTPESDRRALESVQQSQQELAATLATTRGRTDALEARVSEVEANLPSGARQEVTAIGTELNSVKQQIPIMERSLESLLQSIRTLQNTPSTVYTSNDVNTLQRLNEEFAAELATLRGRLDAVEARHSQLVRTYSTTNTTQMPQTPQPASNPAVTIVERVTGNVQVRRASTVGTRGDIFRPVQVGDRLFSNDSIQMSAGSSLSVQCRETNGTLFPAALQTNTPRTLSGSELCPTRTIGGGRR